jgi:Zn-dependent protease
VIISINTIAKKFTSYHLDSKVEIDFWEFTRYGFKENQKFKKPFPSGAFLPLISKIIFFPLNGFVWMASLVFDVKPKIWRHTKRHGLYTFSEITELHMGLIAASGIIANLVFALIGYLIGFSEFAQYSIWYAFFNLIPISNLDGNKIFFGNILIWSTLATITTFALLLSFFIV